eukprot:scaffold53455_cov41-Cyclotella_meneghiniana.AAC.8
MAAVITQQPTGIRPPPSANHSPTPLGIRRCARINSLGSPDVSATTVIAIYVAAGFDRSGSWSVIEFDSSPALQVISSTLQALICSAQSPPRLPQGRTMGRGDKSPPNTTIGPKETTKNFVNTTINQNAGRRHVSWETINNTPKSAGMWGIIM